MPGWVKWPRVAMKDSPLSGLPAAAKLLYIQLYTWAQWDGPDKGALLDSDGRAMSLCSMERITELARSHMREHLQLLLERNLLSRRADGVLLVEDVPLGPPIVPLGNSPVPLGNTPIPEAVPLGNTVVPPGNTPVPLGNTVVPPGTADRKDVTARLEELPLVGHGADAPSPDAPKSKRKTVKASIPEEELPSLHEGYMLYFGNDSGLADDVQQYLDMLCDHNKSGRMSLRRQVAVLAELADLAGGTSDEALRQGLRVATEKAIPALNYVKRVTEGWAEKHL